MDQVNQGREFHGMANAQQAQRSKILSRDHQDSKSPLEPDQEKCQVNQTQIKTIWKTEAATLQGKTVRDVYTRVYDVHNTVFQNKQDNFLPDPNEATNTSWLWWKYIATLFW